MSNYFSLDLLWFLIGLIFLFAELFAPGFVIIFFGIGAFITSLLTWLDITKSFQSQLLVFAFFSILSLLFLRKYFAKTFSGLVLGKKNQDLNSFVGEKAKTITDIKPIVGGKIEFHGTVWSAESDIEIPKNEIVEIVTQNNLTLKVKQIH